MKINDQKNYNGTRTNRHKLCQDRFRLEIRTMCPTLRSMRFLNGNEAKVLAGTILQMLPQYTPLSLPLHCVLPRIQLNNT